MRLISISVESLGLLHGRMDLELDNFTAIVAARDLDADLWLHALAVFLGEQITGFDGAEISCVFDHLPDDLNIGGRAPTTFAAERLLRADGRLEIVKQFDQGLHAPRVHLRCDQPAERALISLNEGDGALIWNEIQPQLPALVFLPAEPDLADLIWAEAHRRRQLPDGQRLIFALRDRGHTASDDPSLLMRALLALSDSPRSQAIIATGDPRLAVLAPAGTVRLMSSTMDGAPRTDRLKPELREQVERDFALSEPPQVEIHIESLDEELFLCRASQIHREADDSLPDLDRDPRIGFAPAKDGRLKHWIGRQTTAADSVVFRTRKHGMENLLHTEVIAAEFGCWIDVTDDCDVVELVAHHVHLNGGGRNTPWPEVDEKTKAKKLAIAKRRLNNAAMMRMTLAQLNQRDRDGEILSWLAAIRDRLARA